MLQTYARFEEMLARNATINPVGLAQQFAMSFKKQLKNVDRDTYTNSDAPIPVRISARPVSGGSVPSSNINGEVVTLATFRSLMDELNLQIKEIKEIDDKVSSQQFLLSIAAESCPEHAWDSINVD